MNELLETLYKEYTALNTKLQKVADLIHTYGGSVPESNNESLSPAAIMGGQVAEVFGDYPKNGTWKEKILYTLNIVAEPMTANQVGLFMAGQESAEDATSFKNMATQYCSTLAGANEINVERGHTNKYSVKK